MDGTKNAQAAPHGLIRTIQGATPAAVVNHSTQIASVLRGLADGTSIKNGLDVKSPERVANGVISLGAGIMGATFRDVPRDNQQEEAQRNMGLLPYMGSRIYEGVFEPHKHISQTIGLATMASCVFSLLAGMRTTTGTRVVGKGYVTNPALLWEDFVKIPRFIKGMLTEGMNGYKPKGNMYGPMELVNAPIGLLGGALLTFSPHEEDGWRWYSGLMIARGITRIPTSIYATTHYNKATETTALSFLDRYAKYDPVIGVTFHQAANLVGFLYGGVRKLPDGTIVRVDELNDTPKLPVEEHKAIPSGGAEDVGPNTKISAAGASRDATVKDAAQQGLTHTS